MNPSSHIDERCGLLLSHTTHLFIRVECLRRVHQRWPQTHTNQNSHISSLRLMVFAAHTRFDDMVARIAYCCGGKWIVWQNTEDRWASGETERYCRALTRTPRTVKAATTRIMFCHRITFTPWRNLHAQSRQRPPRAGGIASIPHCTRARF